jgi:hypothetical protein
MTPKGLAVSKASGAEMKVGEHKSREGNKKGVVTTQIRLSLLIVVH